MSITYKTLDEYYRTAETGDNAVPVPLDGASLDRAMSNGPAPEPPPVTTVWDVYKDRCLEKWKSNGVLFFTLTVNSKMKYKNKYLIRCDPTKQAKYFKHIVRDVMISFNKTVEHHYYIFFEYTKAGVIHCHGLTYPQKDDVIFGYPYWGKELKASATKHGFNSLGVHCEPVKSFADASKYISKDSYPIRKHPILPIYG